MTLSPRPTPPPFRPKPKPKKKVVAKTGNKNVARKSLDKKVTLNNADKKYKTLPNKIGVKAYPQPKPRKIGGSVRANPMGKMINKSTKRTTGMSRGY